MTDGQTRVDTCVEALCQHGCRKVTEYISLLKAGTVFEDVATLSPAERHAVLEELESIMSAYNGPCDS